MSLHIITGKPRGGKSMYSVRLVLDELRLGRRPVVTNLALDLKALVEYLPGVDVVRRVRIMSDAELSEFYLHRGLDSGTNEWIDGHRSGSVPVIPPDGGVFYCIDEAHLVFSQWDKVGRETMWYLSQHAKFGDDCICITQHADMLNKAFRVLAQDFTVLTNLAKVRAVGFRGPARFVRRTFAAWPCTPGAEQETGTFKLDVKGLGSLYSTARGVGIHDRVTADIDARKSGLPWWSLPVTAVAAVVAFLFFARFGTSALLGQILRGPAVARSSASPSPAVAPVPAPAVAPVPAPKIRRAEAVVNGRALFAGRWEPVLWVSEDGNSGLLVSGDRWELLTVSEAQELRRASSAVESAFATQSRVSD